MRPNYSRIPSTIMKKINFGCIWKILLVSSTCAMQVAVERLCTALAPLEWFSMQSGVWDTSWMGLVKDTQTISTVLWDG